MTEWTVEARNRLENYLEQIRDLASQTGDDATEIAEGLREHIDSEIESAGLSLVTADWLEHLLKEIGTPSEVLGRSTQDAEMGPPCGDPDPSQRSRKGWFLLVPVGIWLTAVALPLFSLIFEVNTHAMAELYMDPIPTWWHFTALLIVPFAVGFLQIVSLRPDSMTPRRLRLSLFLGGYVIALCGIYTLAYIPILPLAAVAILVMGLGAMGFAPLCSTIAGIILVKRLYKMRPALGIPVENVLKPLIGAFLFVIVFLGLLHAHQLAIDYGINLALSKEADDQSRGIRLLRTIGGEEAVLERCYVNIFRGPRILRSREKHDRVAYHKLYYRLTGTPYNSVSASALPETFLRTNRERGAWDDGLGGAAVANRIEGLSLLSSHMDANIKGSFENQPGEALAYVEWIMEFKNETTQPQEARAQILMPPGGAATRLTLWIDGEEREAAFGGRRQVREAYQEVAVRQRRDPALLTTQGTDRLLLQCFPVQPNTPMKVKVGMTLPMTITGGKAYLRPPFFSERNFEIPETVQHYVWAESISPLTAQNLNLSREATDDGRHVLRGELSDGQLLDPQTGFLTNYPEIVEPVSFYGRLGDVARIMIIKPARAFTRAERRVCLVIDGSGDIKEIIRNLDWQEVLGSFPDGVLVNAIHAGDTVSVWSEDWRRPGQAQEDLADWIVSRKYVGGVDSVGALERAWDLCAQNPGSAILWIHDDQPVDLSSSEGLLHRYRRRPAIDGNNAPLLLSFQPRPGPHVVEQQIESVHAMHRAPMIGTIQESLKRVARYSNRGLFSEVERVFEPVQFHKTGDGPSQISSHIVRLALHREVLDACRSNNDERQEEARLRAAAARVVTPLTGAVVLERKEQYDRHDLDPNANPEAIPSIPEPEEWLLIMMALGALLFLMRKKRNATPMQTG